MRVGIFSESFEPVRNGVATSVKTLVEELRARRHHVCVLAPHHPELQDESPFVLRVPSVLTPMNPDYPVPYPWFPRLRREVRHLHLDVLHSQTPWFLGLLAARIAKQYRIPHVSTYHTLYDQYAHYLSFLPEPAAQALLEWWMPEFYNRCEHVIVPSRVAERSLRSYGVEAPIAMIPTGVRLPTTSDIGERARQQVRRRWHIPDCAPLLLYVGRLAREKNLDLLLEAFERAAESLGDVWLLIVGDGPSAAECREAAAKQPHGGQVVFAGPVDREQLDPVYAAADLFVFASTSETQGLVIAEARAAGTPSVVTDQGGAAETLRDGDEGIIVRAAPDAIAAAVIGLLQDPERLRKMRDACLHGARDFTPGAMAERVITVYEAARNRVVSRRRPTLVAVG